jgi:hypothetical protein
MTTLPGRRRVGCAQLTVRPGRQLVSLPDLVAWLGDSSMCQVELAMHRFVAGMVHVVPATGGDCCLLEIFDPFAKLRDCLHDSVRGVRSLVGFEAVTLRKAWRPRFAHEQYCMKQALSCGGHIASSN